MHSETGRGMAREGATPAIIPGTVSRPNPGGAVVTPAVGLTRPSNFPDDPRARTPSQIREGRGHHFPMTTLEGLGITFLRSNPMHEIYRLPARYLPTADTRCITQHTYNLRTNTRFRSNDTGLLYGGYGVRIRRIKSTLVAQSRSF